MIFEEALALLREGHKITHASLGEDVYLMGCYVSILNERIERMSIVKMQGDRQHPDMGYGGDIDSMFIPGTLIPKEVNTCKHGTYPQLNLLLVMSDEWSLFDE